MPTEAEQQAEQNQTSENQEQTVQNSEVTSDNASENNDALSSDKENLAAPEKSDASDDSSNENEDVLAAAQASATEETGGKETKTGDSDVPENYSDFDLPDGIEMAPSYMEKMGPVFKKLGLSQASAQELISAHVGHVQESEVGKTNQLTELHKGWLNEAKTDKDIGGDNFDANLKAANSAVNQFGSQEFKTLLKATGLGNHPEIIRVFSKIGSLLKEDVPGNTAVSVPSQKVDVLATMYPDDVPK